MTSNEYRVVLGILKIFQSSSHIFFGTSSRMLGLVGWSRNNISLSLQVLVGHIILLEVERFNEKWERKYIILLNGDKPVLLLRSKEHNLWQHLDTKYRATKTSTRTSLI